MIIYGFRTSESTAGMGAFTCPCCRLSQGYRHVVLSRWFTLYFIPVIPLGRIGEQVECQGCYSRYSPEVLFEAQGQIGTPSQFGMSGQSGMPGQFGTPGDEPLLATVIDDTGPAAQPFFSPAKRPAVPSTSGLAITSLILGLLSPVFLCACGLSLITSLGAIITGHLALSKISRSMGQLEGRGLATAGLVLGYLLFVMSVGSVAMLGPSVYKEWQRGQQQAARPGTPKPKTEEDRLLSAEMRVLTSSTEGVASGNSPEAKKLAADYAAQLQLMRAALFTKDRDRAMSLTGGSFVVHCELHPARCAFIVHVPSYRDFSSEAKSELEKRSWQLAQVAVAKKLSADDKLAVGLRGAVMYGAVIVGRAGPRQAEGEDFTRAERRDLAAFFPAEAELHALPAEAPTVVADRAPDPSRPEKVLAALPPKRAANQPTIPPFGSPFGPPGMAPGGPPFGPKGFPGGNSPPPGGPQVFPPGISPGPGPFGDPGFPGKADERVMRPAGGAPSSGRAPESQLDELTDIVQRFPDLGWSMHSLAFAPGGGYLAAGKLDETVLVLDTKTGQRVDAKRELRDLGQVKCVAYSFDGAKLLAGGYRGKISLWNVDEQGRLQSARLIHGHEKEVTYLAASPAAPFVASGSSAGDVIWQSYDNPTQVPRRLAAFQRPTLAIFLPKSGLEAWATDGRRLTHELGRGTERAVAFSSDGSMVAICLGSEVRLFKTATGAEVRKLSTGQMQWSVAFSSDNKRLITGGSGKASLWRVEDGQPESEVDLGGILPVKSLAISSEAGLMAAIPSAAGQTLTVVRLPSAP